MSFTIIAVDTPFSPNIGFSTPYQISFAVIDDGSGGSILLNGVGVNDVVGANVFVDIRTLFGTAFRSPVLLSLFQRPLPALTDANVCRLFAPNLSIEMLRVGDTNSVNPLWDYIANVNGHDGPFLTIKGPQVAATWRINIALRHSMDNGSPG